jgi:hypothetical protein
MSEQPLPLHLADALDNCGLIVADEIRDQAADELRRLHELHVLYQDKVQRLTAALKRANSQAEHFEREWYLRGDEIEQLKEQYEASIPTPRTDNDS